MSKLSKLEKKLTELFNSNLDAEKLFYLGIQIGRELERNSITEYVSLYFEDRKHSSALQLEKHKIVAKINCKRLANRIYYFFQPMLILSASTRQGSSFSMSSND